MPNVSPSHREYTRKSGSMTAAAKVAALNAAGFKGFLIPYQSDALSGQHTFERREDFEKVRLGYACAFCLAEYSMYTPVCVMCGNQRDVNRDIQQTPEIVQADYDEVSVGGEKTVARSPDEALRAIMDDPSIEHVQLDKLKRRNRSAR